MTTLKGESLTLADLRGAPVWMAFSRFASCPLCNYRVHQMIGEWPARYADYNFRLFNVFQSPSSKLDDYVAKQEPPFDLVADHPSMGLYEKYGLESSVKAAFSMDVMKTMVAAAKIGLPLVRPFEGPAFRVPADFLIDSEGILRVVFYGATIAEHIPFEQADAFLAQYATKRAVAS
ncbi:MAG: redoxin domain-containing protein [Myxococcales bacterium]|nr:redoxin domain-containing protein [Myxococcales bacterium]MCB9567841.1 redoxin domain-containing protein [Myxococcales bacterium]MCB9700286.1 redoxin domain-containing protein [Myxococcales bacterium]